MRILGFPRRSGDTLRWLVAPILQHRQSPRLQAPRPVDPSPAAHLLVMVCRQGTVGAPASADGSSASLPLPLSRPKTLFSMPLGLPLPPVLLGHLPSVLGLPELVVQHALFRRVVVVQEAAELATACGVLRQVRVSSQKRSGRAMNQASIRAPLPAISLPSSCLTSSPPSAFPITPSSRLHMSLT